MSFLQSSNPDDYAHHYFLSLGSNVEPRLKHLDKAKRLLAKKCLLRYESHVYETEPLTRHNAAISAEAQLWHYNQALQIDSQLNPTQLLEFIKTCERKVGRTKREVWGPREIDIDILLYNNDVIDTVELQIPHKELPNRNFVLVPLAEIAAYVREPRTDTSIEDLLEHSTDSLDVRLLETYEPLNY